MEPATRKVVILSSKEMMGDGHNTNTMDYTGDSSRAPTLSLIIPKLTSFKVLPEVVNWMDLNEEYIKSQTEQKTVFLIGPVWDYHYNSEQFRKLMEIFQALHANLVNAADIVLWNMDKRYLADLEKMGLAIPKTLFVETPTIKHWTEVANVFRKEFGDNEVVLKPFVDASADNFHRIKISPENDEKNAKVFEKLKEVGRGILVQRYVPEIRTKGEIAFVFFGAEYQYLFFKVPKRDSDLVGGGYWEIARTEAEVAAKLQYIKTKCRKDFTLQKEEVMNGIQMAKKYMEKFFFSRKGKSTPRYTRLDGVVAEGKLLVIELELIEPYLHLKGAIEGDTNETYLKKYIESILY